MRSIFLIKVIFLLILTSCKNREIETKALIKSYYNIYNSKIDFEAFLNFYDDNAQLEDIISGEKVIGKNNLRSFFNWESTDLERSNNSLVIEDQIISKKKVVTRGYFTPFKWKKQKFEAMYFVTIHYFNESGKIRKQIDWINYPKNLLDYNNRENSNSWIDEVSYDVNDYSKN